MRKILRYFSALCGALILGLALAGCSAPAAPAQPPVVQTVVQTVVVVITADTPAQAPSDTSEPPTDTPTLPGATPAPQVNPSPTPLQLVNIPIEGGDSNHMFFARLVFPDYGPAATTSLMFQVYAHSPVNAAKDGDGIVSVDFTIFDPDGNQVYERLEKTPGFCAFGGGEPDCTVFDFAGNNYLWPNGGGKIVSGRYTIRVEALSKDNVDMNGQSYFNIQVP
jgi:hypothetical protein